MKNKILLFICILAIAPVRAGTLHCYCNDNAQPTQDPVSLSVGSGSDEAFRRCKILCIGHEGMSSHPEIR
ncbi:MAG: hypothetical protein WC707_01230 [Candidatus Babeliaceae bacterium]